MPRIESWFAQYLLKPVKVHYLDGNVFSQDNSGNRVGVSLTSDGESVSVSGTVSGSIIRSDGGTVSVYGSSSENRAWIDLPQTAYAYPGVISIVIKVTDSNGTTTVCAVVANVYESTTSAVVDPGTIIPSISTLIAEIEEAVASIPADYSSLWESLAPAFSSSVSYHAGQYVTYNGAVYRFTTSHSGSWNSSHVTTVSLGSDLENILATSYVGMRGSLSSADDMFALPYGSYYISATAANKPSNLPGDFGSTSAGYAVVLENDNNESNLIICVQAYAKRVWMRTGYDWIEITKYDFLYERLIPKLVHIAEDSYAPYSAISTTKTQYKFLDDDGVQSVGSSYSDWYVTDEIDVQPYTFYYVTASAQYADHNIYNILDSNGNLIVSEKSTSSSVRSFDKKLIFTPNNAAKIQLASVTGSDGAVLNYAVEKNISQKWVGKKWVCIGDSLTENNIRTTKHYHDYIADKTGITVVNLGKGGTGYKRSYDGEGPFIDRVSSIPLDADVVTGNDGIYTIGDPSDTGTDTLCGAINTTISAIFSRITTCQLGIITPCPWESYNPADETNWMARYSAAIVEICNRWGIPCLDLYHCSNLRPWDSTFRAAAYSKDDGGGVHPDETGHALIAPRFEWFLDSLLLH